jgi:hydroxymethylbilane synthase
MQCLRLGTRGSLLARAQSRQVAAVLEGLHPGLQVELVTVTTRGDRDQQVPLKDVRDPDFFSAEIDEALLAGDVDCAVHSLKDLPAVRPAGITTAALPARENPRDVIVWRGDVPARLAAGQALRIGSSSPRREGNVADFLAWALPVGGHPARLEFVPLRGPVDARLARLHQPRQETGALDGIVLALAGLARLWNDPAGRAALTPLLAGVKWQVLPLGHCPAAAGQGVLAVECRTGDTATRDALRSLHDPQTAELVAIETAALDDVDLRDRPAFGVTAIRHGELGPVCFIRGRVAAGVLAKLDWREPPQPPEGSVGFAGLAWQRACTRRPAGPLPQLARLGAGSAVFAAYWHAVQDQALPKGVRLWVSGVESWRRLAALGHWVEGCGDNLGFNALLPTLATPVLGLPPLQEWTALTYGWATAGWRTAGVGQIFATYDILPPTDANVLAELARQAAGATHFYWSSPEQFHGLRAALPAGAHLACGAGKTLQALRAAGVDAQPFPSGREWQRWLR